MNLLAAASTSLSAAYARFEGASGAVLRAASGDPSADLVGATAESIAAKAEATAATQVVRAADEMLGRVLDITA